MRAALWLRVSHGDGDQDTGNQRIALQAWVERLGLELAKVYQVEASGHGRGRTGRCCPRPTTMPAWATSRCC